MNLKGKSIEYIKGYKSALKDRFDRDMMRIKREMDKSRKQLDESFEKIRQLL